MPRMPSEKVIEAEKLFNDGMAMVEIAKRIGVPDGTVRRWKSSYGWGDQPPKANATLQKRKRGGQPGNQNAKGGAGNPNPKKRISPDAAVKHGGYRRVSMNTLDEDERELVGRIPEDEETLLWEQIQLYSIRERRLLKLINRYREMDGEVVPADVSRFEEKRSFKDDGEAAEYDRRQKIKVDKGDILPGKPYNIQTHATNKDLFMARLEQVLSVIQSRKTKAIEVLSNLRLEKVRIEGESASSDTVDNWVAAVLGNKAENEV